MKCEEKEPLVACPPPLDEATKIEKVEVKGNTISSKNAREASWGFDIAAGAVCKEKTAKGVMDVATWATN